MPSRDYTRSCKQQIQGIGFTHRHLVLEETPVNKVLHSQYRVNTKQAVPFASLDKHCNESDPACPSESQVSNNTGSLVRMQKHVMPSTVFVDNTQCTDDVLCSRKVNSSLFSQPNALATPQCLDLKAEVGSCDPTYSNTAIPLNVWNNHFQCVDYQRCTQQNGFEFGAVQLTPVKLYEGKNTNNQPILGIIQLTQYCTLYKFPNFLGCRIPVQTQLKPRAWRYYL